MIKILNIKQPPIKTLEIPRTWIIEVLGQRKDDILVLKDLFEDHYPHSGLYCKGIQFNTGFPSFSEIGAKLVIKDYTTLSLEECNKSILKILYSLIS